MKLIVRILIFSAAFYTVYTLCNTCSAISGIACVANDQFSVCVDGLPTSTITQCPNGTVCTASGSVCSPAETTEGSCGMCGVCNGNSTFACTSYNTFALCYGSTAPDVTVNYTCAGSTACYYDDPQICLDPLIGIGATCPSVAIANATTPTTMATTVNPVESTTPGPTINPLTFCANVTSSGRYEVTTDVNCKQYVVCALVNSTWIGNLYECPGSTLFNSTSRLCGVEVPLRCVT